MISYEEKYRILRVAVIMAIDDLRFGLHESVVDRLSNVVKGLGEDEEVEESTPMAA